MIREARVQMRVVASALVLAVVALLLGCRSRTEGLDPSKLPEDIRADYHLFAHRCSKCHSLARPLTSGISDDEQWVLYVNRMRRQPGSGITMQDQEHILRFLRHYAAELRKKDAEKRGLVPPASASAAPAAPAPPASNSTQVPAPAPAAGDGG